MRRSKSAGTKLVNFVRVHWDALKVCSFITKIPPKLIVSHYIIKHLGK
jgi:hypothetical protein